MRRLASLVVALALALTPGCVAHSAPKPADDPLVISADPRIELFSILFALAENPEYQPAPSPYARAAQLHFAPSRDHPAVQASRDLRAQRGISYEAPLQLAIYLDAELHPIRPLDGAPGMDRWHGVDLDDYLAKVRDFAKVTDFDGFYKSQAAHHAAAEQRFRDAFHGVPIVAFFEERFGAKPHTVHRLVPGFFTGKMNYGIAAVHADGGEDLVQVMFLENPDADGLPRPGELTLDLMVHETAHPYVNPIVDANLAQLTDVATPLFTRFAEQLRGQHYTTVDIMLREAVVRALVIVWLRAHADQAHVERSLAEQARIGFPYTAALADALGNSPRFDAVTLVAATRAGLAAWSAAH